MRAVLMVTVVLVSLGGCTDAADDAPADAPAALATSTPMDNASLPAASPVAVTLPIAFDGNLGTSGHGCVFPAGACQSVDVTTDASDLLVERAGSNLTALSFDVAWTATTPATATLTVSAMVMGTCDECNSTMFDEVTGTSPLHIQVEGVSVPLDAEHVIHLFVYNPQGLVYNDAVPAYGYASLDQAFHIEGTATLLAPGA